MIKTLLLAILLATLLPHASAQDDADPTRVTVNVGAERLESLLTDEQKQSVTHLTVTGTLQEADYAYLRAGLLGQLTELNLRDADIDTIPPYAFSFSPSNYQNIITIILPVKLEYLSDNALCLDLSVNCTFVLTGGYPTLGKNVYSEGGGFYGDRILPSNDNEMLRFENSNILSLDGSILYRSNNPYIGNIPESIRIIGANAFEHGYIVGTASIPNTVDSIGDRAFANVIMGYPAGTGELPYMLCRATTPPKLGKNVFVYDTEYSLDELKKIYVPDESVAAYQTAKGWEKLDILALSVERPPYSNTNRLKNIRSNGKINVYKRHGMFMLQADKTIVKLSGYDAKGVLLFSLFPNNDEESIPTSSLSSPVTIVRVNYADGTSETLKLKP